MPAGPAFSLRSGEACVLWFQGGGAVNGCGAAAGERSSESQAKIRLDSNQILTKILVGSGQNLGEFSSGTAAKTRENHGIEKRLRKRDDRLIRRTQTNLCDRLFSKMSAVPNHVIDDSFLHLLPNGTFLLIGTILAYQKRVGKRILWIILRKSSQEQEHSAINLENVRKVFFSNSSRDDANLRMEIDFLIAKSKISSRHDISLIEVKSGKNDTLTSLRKFQKKI